MKQPVSILILVCWLLIGCKSTPTTSTPELLRIQYTAASAPWLANLTKCAGGNVISSEQRIADFLDAQSVDMALRIGNSNKVNLPAYRIGSDDILVIVNRQNPINALTIEQVKGLFSGQIQTWQGINGTSVPVQVWSFFEGEDVQQIFEQAVLGGSPVTSTARLASDPNEMTRAVSNNTNAIGVLTKHWMMGNILEVYSVTTVPVLAITPSKPTGADQAIIACMQH